MIELSPRIQFQQRTEEVKTFNELIAHPVMRTALTHAFAHLGIGGVTPDELMGAKKFMKIFATLGDKTEPVEEGLPVRELKTM